MIWKRPLGGGANRRASENSKHLSEVLRAVRMGPWGGGGVGVPDRHSSVSAQRPGKKRHIQGQLAELPGIGQRLGDEVCDEKEILSG